MLFRSDSIKSEPQSVIHFRLNRLQLFEVQAILESMQEEIDSRHLLWNIENTIYLFELFILLLRIYNNPAYPATTEKDTFAVVKYVEKNFRKNFTIKIILMQLSNQLGTCMASRLIKDEYGVERKSAEQRDRKSVV